MYSFRLASETDPVLIERWFAMEHVQEFWGSPETNIQDFKNHIQGDRTLFTYWLAAVDGISFALLLTSNAANDTPAELLPYMPENGVVWTLDVLIGEVKFVGKGHGTPMIRSFLAFVKKQEPYLVRVFIDPEEVNGRAIHVYEKAGFRRLDNFLPEEGPFAGVNHVLLCHDFDSEMG